MHQKTSVNKFLIYFYALFIISTLITVWIVYKLPDHSWTYPVIISYLVLAFGFLVYFLIISFLKIKKLDNRDIKKRVKRFVFYFILLNAVSFTLALVGFTDLNIASSLSISFGLSCGIAFLDVAFTKGIKAEN